MSFKLLYNIVQQSAIPVKSDFIKDEVKRLTGINLNFISAGLNPDICKGFYFSPKNIHHPMFNNHKHFSNQFSGDVVVISRALNPCWKRFVKVKETMHSFSKPEQKVTNFKEFEDLLDNLTGIAASKSIQMQSEEEAFWMALAILCPEKDRILFKKQIAENTINDYGVAIKLKIPQVYVPHLLDEGFEQIIRGILAQNSE